jgi:hypothetical protein
MAEAGEAPSNMLEEIVDAQVFGGGVHHFHYGGKPNHEPIEAHDGDIELMLQGMIVRMPEEPIYINDKPYLFDFDDTRLVHAVHDVRTNRVTNRGRWEPRMLEISLADNLPSLIEGTDTQPGAGSDSGNADRPSYPFERATDTLNVVLPTEVMQSSTETKELVSTVEAAANRQLALGLEQITQMKDRNLMQRFAIAGRLAAYVAVGEAVSQAAPNAANTAPAGRLALGVFCAILLGTVSEMAKAFYTASKHGESRSIDTLVRKAYETAVEKNPSLKKPIISLVPVEEEPEPQAA